MKIIIMRHGEAEHFANSDEERALTDNGRTSSITAALRAVEHGVSQFDRVLVSPYKRAQQTWQAVSTHWQGNNVELCADITPYGDSEDVFEYVNAFVGVDSSIDSLLIVSHLPLVGYLAAEFVAGLTPPMFPTSGIVCIDYNPTTQQGELLWKV